MGAQLAEQVPASQLLGRQGFAWQEVPMQRMPESSPPASRSLQSLLERQSVPPFPLVVLPPLVATAPVVPVPELVPVPFVALPVPLVELPPSGVVTLPETGH